MTAAPLKRRKMKSGSLVVKMTLRGHMTAAPLKLLGGEEDVPLGVLSAVT